MRKSFAVFLFIVILASLFMIENIYSLMKGIDNNLRQETLQQARTYADLLLPQLSDPLPKSVPYFDQVAFVTIPGPASVIIGETRDERVVIHRETATGKTVVFIKRLESSVFQAVHQLKSILFWMVIILALFLLASAIYLVVVLFRKKGKDIREEDLLTPLQDYLIELKSSQEDLETTLQEQSQLTQKRENLNQSIIQNLNQALIFVNSANRVELINQAAQTLFGVSYSQATNSRLNTLLSRFPELCKQLENGPAPDSPQVESGGRIFYSERISVALYGQLFLIRDITDEVNRERLQNVNASLILLGEMTAALAHEIKNSLGVMLGYAKTMQGDAESTEKIVQQIRHLTAMMENFLNFARPMNEPHFIDLDFGKIAAEQAAAHQLEIELPATSPSLRSDPVLLQSVLFNLFLNSRQAGATRLQIRHEFGPPQQITICDNGTGLPLGTDPNKIWLPFFSTRENGTGMGLALVKKLINHLHGDIGLIESSAQGTAFRLTFFSE